MAVTARRATDCLLYDMQPRGGAAGDAAWVMRAANFAVAYSHVRAGEVLARDVQPDEYMLLVPPGMSATIEAGDDREILDGGGLAIVPPGRSRVTAKVDGYLVRIVSAAATDIVAEARNADAYRDDVDDVVPLGDEPPPVGGYRLRCHRFADYEVETAGKPFLLFRSQYLMANVFKPFVRPRDTTALSPHHHDDFEQCSLALSGDWVHALRYPWGPDLATWRPDEDRAMGSPSMLIIPPKVVHTTYVTSADGGWLLDIFAPPRSDFLARPGLVLNAADYPATADLEATA